MINRFMLWLWFSKAEREAIRMVLADLSRLPISLEFHQPDGKLMPRKIIYSPHSVRMNYVE